MVSSARVLLAEDEPTVSKTLVTQLEAEGFEVRAVAAIRELRQEMESDPPDVLVLDDTLDVDGLEYLQSIRFAAHHPRAGVLVISESVTARERGLQLGAAGAVAKPVDGRTLIEALHELLAFM